ncbi:hypothetical protein CXF95_12910 [Paraglaciecola sp. MB-3u-78]|nr:hypothetical protein CXF95_12910 [Paraglaciecola sp. MB-3u-78]
MINSKKVYNLYLAKDKENGTFQKSFLAYLLNDTWKFLRRLRLLEYVTNTKTGVLWSSFGYLVKLLFKSNSKKLGFSIPPNVFGPGLSLPHYGNIIINRRVRIGANAVVNKSCLIENATLLGVPAKVYPPKTDREVLNKGPKAS